MSLAAVETCPHPSQRWDTVVAGERKLLGFYRCKRCGLDLAELHGRARELQISPRVTIDIDQCVAISEPQGWPSYGRFKYAETQPSGRIVAAVLTPDGWRFVTPERLTRAGETRCSKPSAS